MTDVFVIQDEIAHSIVDRLKLTLEAKRLGPLAKAGTKSLEAYELYVKGPLYRQCKIYERQGIELERSTLADWVGGTSALFDPLVEALRRYVMAANKLHADDTRVPVLAPGTGKTKTGRLWTYVRDD